MIFLINQVPIFWHPKQVLLNYLDLKLLDVVTNHPVHIVDAEGRISPSALIPFCDLEGNMSVLGRDIQGFSQPVCTAFKRIVFNDQLCYQVNVTQYQDRVERSQIYERGISFVIDTNEDRQYLDREIKTEETQQNLGRIIVLLQYTVLS